MPHGRTFHALQLQLRVTRSYLYADVVRLRHPWDTEPERLAQICTKEALSQQQPSGTLPSSSSSSPLPSGSTGGAAAGAGTPAAAAAGSSSGGAAASAAAPGSTTTTSSSSSSGSGVGAAVQPRHGGVCKGDAAVKAVTSRVLDVLRSAGSPSIWYDNPKELRHEPAVKAVLQDLRLAGVTIVRPAGSPLGLHFPALARHVRRGKTAGPP